MSTDQHSKRVDQVEREIEVIGKLLGREKTFEIVSHGHALPDAVALASAWSATHNGVSITQQHIDTWVISATSPSGNSLVLFAEVAENRGPVFDDTAPEPGF